MSAGVLTGYRPGCIGRIIELHGAYYAREWGFPKFFEAKVAREMGAFFDAYDPARDGFWSVWLSGHCHGGIAIDGKGANENGAHLRWFIMSDELRGQGFGKRLVNDALDFCRARGYPSVHLWTFKGLDPARALYDRAGFVLETEREGEQWGKMVVEQYFIVIL